MTILDEKQCNVIARALRFLAANEPKDRNGDVELGGEYLENIAKHFDFKTSFINHGGVAIFRNEESE